MCAAVPVRALLQLPLLGVERGYKGLYGGGWPLRGMGAAGTALGAADARTNEHYEINAILTQLSHGSLMARSAPNSPKRSRDDEPTGIAHPKHVFEARAPAAHECPAHDKSAWTQTKYTGPPELTYTATLATGPHRTVSERKTGRENSRAEPKKEQPRALSLSLSRFASLCFAAAPHAHAPASLREHESNPGPAVTKPSPEPLRHTCPKQPIFGDSYTLPPCLCLRT